MIIGTLSNEVMRSDCTYKGISEICEILNGFAFKSGEYEDDGVRIMRITNVQKGMIVDDDPKYFPLSRIAEIKRYILKEGDLLMSLTGNVGRVGLLDEMFLPAALNQRVACLRLKNDSVIIKYLFYLLNSKRFELDCIFNASGIAQKNMSTQWLGMYKIPIPHLEEQERIVAELDLISGVIEKQKAQLKELDNLAQSIFYDMFGDPVTNEKKWSVQTLSDVCINLIDCPHSTPKKVTHKTNFPCIRTSELKNGSIEWNSMQYIDEIEYKARTIRLKPISGDIVFGREGTIGDAVILPEGYCFSLGQRTMLLRVDGGKVSNVFLHRVILSEWIKKYVRQANVSSTVAHINVKDFRNFVVPIPPLPLQQEFAQKIQAIEQQKACIKNSIKEMETLLQSRMDYYFD